MHADLRTRLTGDTAIAALVSTRVYWHRLPQDLTMPCLRLVHVDGDSHQSHDGSSGLATSRVQVSAFAASHLAATALAEKVRLRLQGYKGTTGSTDFQSILVANGPMDIDDDDETVTHIAYDFEVSYAEAQPA